MELNEFKSLLESPINGLIKGLGNELKQVAKNRILEYQTNEYKRNYFTKTLLHRSEPIKLLDFYLPLHISTYEDTIEQQKSKRISTADIFNLFKKTNYITIIGSAGSGKSTIVKYLFINSVKTGFKIPIKVELRYLNEYKGSISDYIIDEVFLFYKLGFSKEIVDRLLSSGAFMFFFDGYDEVNSLKKENVTIALDKFVSRYPENYYLITSRPYTNIDILPLFKNFLVCDLLDSEIPPFIKKQIPISENELAEKIIKSISEIENDSYKAFLSNPLLLSMFILTYQSYSEIPKKRSDFYKQVFDTLYSVHDSVSKLSFVREKQSGLSKEGFEEFLKLFSFISYFEEKFLFKPEYLESKLSIIKEKKKHLNFNIQKVIEDLQIAIGILNKEGTDYTFPHRSIQEYFAANYICSLSESNKKIIINKIIKSIENNWIYPYENSHFLTLLLEQDYISFLNYLVLPILKKLNKRAKNYNIKGDLNVKYDIACKIYMITYYLLNRSLYMELIHKDFNVDNGPGVIIFPENNIFPLPSDKKLSLETERIENSFNVIIEKSDKWIESLEIKIDEQEKSDSEIISII